MESYSAASLVGRENYAVTTTVLYAAGVPGATNTARDFTQQHRIVAVYVLRGFGVSVPVSTILTCWRTLEVQSLVGADLDILASAAPAPSLIYSVQHRTLNSVVFLMARTPQHSVDSCI